MITLKDLQALNNNDGLTLKRFNAINYKTGYQVATEGVECSTAEKALEAIASYNGTCGVWYSDGIYYIDRSHREGTLREALRIGREHNQQSILKWNNMSLVWC